MYSRELMTDWRRAKAFNDWHFVLAGDYSDSFMGVLKEMPGFIPKLFEKGLFYRLL